MGKLDDQHALVTGGDAGLGRAIAHALAAEGARVAVQDLDGARAERVLGELGGRASRSRATSPTPRRCARPSRRSAAASGSSRS